MITKATYAVSILLIGYSGTALAQSDVARALNRKRLEAHAAPRCDEVSA